MAHSELQTIIGTAIVNDAFCRQLLESPAAVVDEFVLTPEERGALLSIRADSLAEFAAQLEQLLSPGDSHASDRVNGHNNTSDRWVLLG